MNRDRKKAKTEPTTKLEAASSSSAGPVVVEPSADRGPSDALKARICDLLRRHAGGMLANALNQHFTKDEQKSVINTVNKMLQSHEVELLMKDVVGPDGPRKDVYYKLVDEDLARKLKNKMEGLTADERLVYELIKSSGEQGLWSATIKRRLSNTGVTSQLKKILLNLERRELVKQEKSIKAANRKVYILWDLVPSVSIKGRFWYHNGTYEASKLNTTKALIKQWLRSSTNTTHTVSAESLEPILQKLMSEKKDAASQEDLCYVLQSMVADGELEPICKTQDKEEELGLLGKHKMLIPPPDQSFRLRRDRASNAMFVEIPCSSCPVASRCHPGGDVNPQDCRYMTSWLEHFSEPTPSAPPPGALGPKRKQPDEVKLDW